MNNNISSEILNWQSESNLNWNALVDYIYNKGIVIIDSKLKSGFGMATYYGIHLNMDYFKFVNGEIRYFLICHEIGHYVSLIEQGLDYHLNMLSSSNLNDVYNHIVNEEKRADDFALNLYNILNNISFEDIHNNINDEYLNKNGYMETAKYIFGRINNSEQNYKNIINEFIIN